MVTMPIMLADGEAETLRLIAEQTNTPPEEIISQVIQQFIIQFHMAEQTHKGLHTAMQEAAEQATAQIRLARFRKALEGAFGIWKDRTDLPDLDELRGRYRNVETVGEGDNPQTISGGH